MKHETIRERLCLRLYGELDETEAAALEEHLGSCPECSAFAAELESGLGALAAGEARAAERLADDGWRPPALPAPRAVRPAPWLAFAAGLAAGVLVAYLAGVRSGSTPGDPSGPPPALLMASNAAPARAPLRFDAPPPPAASRGQAGQLGIARRR